MTRSRSAFLLALLLGAGFIVGGYCPGTSIVAGVSGKIDALLFMGGIVLGSGAYTLAGETMAPPSKVVKTLVAWKLSTERSPCFNTLPSCRRTPKAWAAS